MSKDAVWTTVIHFLGVKFCGRFETTKKNLELSFRPDSFLHIPSAVFCVFSPITIVMHHLNLAVFPHSFITVTVMMFIMIILLYVLFICRLYL